MAGLLSLPSFLLAVGALFWCFQGAALTGFLQWWRLRAPRNDTAAAVIWLKAVFRYRLRLLGAQEPVQGRKCMYLCNHRGWADFFVDMYATGVRAVPLSRMAVGAAFPAFTTSLLAVKSILLFNRAGIKDTEPDPRAEIGGMLAAFEKGAPILLKFNAWLDQETAQGPQNSLLVYPEGKRSQKAQSLPLKRGMLRYAFTRRLPVQAVVTSHKEQVLNERRRWAHFGRTLVIGCSDVLESSQFEDFEAFMAAVQALWDAQWQTVHDAAPEEIEGLPELVPSFPELRYTPAQLAAESAALAFWLAVLAAGAYLCLAALAALAAVPGGPLLLAALGAWTAASLVAAWRPPPTRRGGGSSSTVGGGGSDSALPPAEPAAAAAKED